jgi:hypothetical protein
MVEMRNAYKSLVRKPEGKRPLRKSERRLQGNIKMGIRKIGWGAEDWIHVVQEMDQWQVTVKTVM